MGWLALSGIAVVGAIDVILAVIYLSLSRLNKQTTNDNLEELRQNKQSTTYDVGKLSPYNQSTNYDVKKRGSYKQTTNSVTEEPSNIPQYLPKVTFTLNSNVCTTFREDIPIPVIAGIKTAVDHFSRRQEIRKTWGHPTDFLKVVFFVGQNVTYDPKIVEEHETYGDIVQGDFPDTYRNLTQKTMMGLKWVTQYCPRAEAVIMIDDDTFVNLKELKFFLKRNYKSDDEAITCKVRKLSYPVRERDSSSYVGEDVFSGTIYPHYCSGIFAIYTPKAVKKLVAAAQNERYISAEDLFVTGIVRLKTNVTLNDIEYLFLEDMSKDEILVGNMKNVPRFLFGPWYLEEGEMTLMWNRLQEHEKINEIL